MSVEAHVLFSPPSSSAMNMALDEALSLHVRKPTLRFHHYAKPSITLGHFENPARTLNLEKCSRHAVPMVRRLTGGRAVLHAGDCTFTLLVPGGGGPETTAPGPWYAGLAKGIRNALDDLNLDALLFEGKLRRRHGGPCFAATSQHELIVKGKKILGMAQRRTRDGMFIQCTLLVGPESLHLGDYLNRMDRRGLQKEMTYLHRWRPGVGMQSLQALLTQHIGRQFAWTFARSTPGHAVRRKAASLIRTRYGSDAWNFARLGCTGQSTPQNGPCRDTSRSP